MKTFFTKYRAFVIIMLVVNLLFVGGVMGQTNTWDGSSSNSWNTAANWSLNAVPNSAHDVVIPNSTSYGTAPRIDVTPITIKSLTVGGGTDGTLEFNRSISQSMTVTNNVVVNSGATFRMRTGGSLSGSSLLIGGNFTNSGTVDFVDADVVNVTFNGTANQSVSGTGATMQLNNVTINNTGAANDNIVEVSSTNFTVPAAFLTLTDGIFKVSRSLTNTFFTPAAYTIPAGTGIWLNHASAIVTAQNGSPILNGSIQVTLGDYNIGSSTGNSLTYNTGSSFKMEGGTVDIAGRFNGVGTTQTTTFDMSGGTLTTIVTGTSSNTFSSFDISAAGSSFTMSGGTIVIEESNAGTAGDYRNVASTTSITGGTVQFGNANTGALALDDFDISLAGPHTLPSLTIVDNATSVPTLTLAAGITVKGNLTINTGTSLLASGQAITVSGNSVGAPGNWTNNGTFTSGTQTTTFNGTATQTISGSSTPAFSSLTTNNPVGVTISSSVTVNATFLATNTGTVNITGGTTTLGASATMTVNPLATFKVTTPGVADFAGKSVTVKSDATGTGAIGTSTGTISNATNITVERYIPANTRRAWRFLSIPTSTTQTINAAWQNAQTAGSTDNTGIGTWITSNNANASFDAQTPGNSMLSYNIGTDNWSGVANTNSTNIVTDGGYMLFIRGDRSATNVNATITPTTLKTTGALKMGTYTSSAINIGSGQFKDVGNPYPSAVNFNSLTKSGGTVNAFTVWDPKLLGVNNVGGYVTFSSTNSWLPSVPGGSYANVLNQTIESGQAFLVQATGSAGTVQFTEASKTTNANVPFTPVALVEKISSTIFAIPGDASSVIDGNAVVYDNLYANAVDIDDVVKPANFSTGFGMIREGKNLVIEGRQLIGLTDTVYYNLTNLQQRTYQIKLVTENLNHPGLLGKLVDNYLVTETPVDLNGTTMADFTVTADPASAAADRFKIVIYTPGPLPVTFTSIKAVQQANDIAVEWKVENQTNIKQYEVEKSTDGRSFTKVATQIATGANGSAATYNWLDVNTVNGDNFYRVKSIGLSGDVQYTRIVKVRMGKSVPAITVYPNPVTDRVVTIQFTDMAKGNYTINLVNQLGQIVQSKQLAHTGANAAQTLSIDRGVAIGNYQLQVIKPGGEKEVLKLLITE